MISFIIALIHAISFTILSFILLHFKFVTMNQYELFVGGILYGLFASILMQLTEHIKLKLKS